MNIKFPIFVFQNGTVRHPVMKWSVSMEPCVSCAATEHQSACATCPVTTAQGARTLSAARTTRTMALSVSSRCSPVDLALTSLWPTGGRAEVRLCACSRSKSVIWCFTPSYMKQEEINCW